MAGQILEKIRSHLKNQTIETIALEDKKIPLEKLRSDAEIIWARLQKSDVPYSNKLMLATLNELLTCQIKFVTGLYVSIFLDHDYKDDIDRRVFNYLKGIYNNYNEFIGLAEELSFFLKKNQPKPDGEHRPFFIELYKVKFKNLKLQTPPVLDDGGELTAEAYIKYGSHLMDVMKKVATSFSFLNEMSLELELDRICCDNMSVFQNAAQRLINTGKLPRNPKKKFEQRTGKCWMRVDETLRIRLDPIIIPLTKATLLPRTKESEIDVRYASLKKFTGYQTVDHEPIVYNELNGENLLFNTRDPNLFKDLFEKRGTVSEAPSFSRQYKVPKNGVQIQSYVGDIFDLNFIDPDGETKTAMVNLLNKDLSCKTPLSISLENLDGGHFLEDLKNQVKGSTALEKNKLYITQTPRPEILNAEEDSSKGPGHERAPLKFTYIFHCPIYGTDENQDHGLKGIKSIIKQILEACAEHQVECLIAPPMGSFFAGQVRKDVASTWYTAISELDILAQSKLKRVIFSFINEEACNEYHKVFSMITGEKFKDYHLPVYLMYNNIVTSSTPKTKIDSTLDLCSYLYCFMTAWAIRSLIWEKIRARDLNQTFSLTDDQKDFVTELCKNAGLIPSDENAWSKGIGFGHWRTLAFKGYKALKSGNSAWSFDKWYENYDGYDFKVLDDFMKPSGEYDYPALRNSRAHSVWLNTDDENEVAETSVKKMEKIIQNMPFIITDKNKLAQIKRFSVKVDTDEVQIDYIQLDGKQSIRPVEKPNSTREALDGLLFELDAVYLIEQLDDDSVKALNLHPFVLYGKCKTCQKSRLYVWRDFVSKKNKKLKIDYGSTGCRCDLSHDFITRYKKNDLAERFSAILKKLKEDL